DVNGDHKADVCGRLSDGIHCAISNGVNGFTNEHLWNGNFSDGNGWTQEKYYATIQFPDVDGDGSADICARGIDGILCALSDGNSFVGDPQVWLPYFRDSDGLDFPQFYRTIHFPDINGDHHADVCGRGRLGVYCGISLPGHFGGFGLRNPEFSDSL